MPLIQAQCRLAASLVTTLLIAATHWLPVSAQASELLSESLPLDVQLDASLEILPPSYEPDFGAFDQSILGRQVPAGAPRLRNNVPQKFNILPGQTICYVVEKDLITSNETGKRSVDLAEQDDSASDVGKRQTGPADMWFSATTCLQISPSGRNTKNRVPPQLILSYSSKSLEDCMRGPQILPEFQKSTFEEGLGELYMSLSEDVYVGVTAPNVTKSEWEGVYNFELAASVDELFHQFDTDGTSDAQLLWMDSDATAALLLTKNLTTSVDEIDRVTDNGLQFDLFVENDEFKVFDGIRRSVCGMEASALIHANREGTGRLNTLVKTVLTKQGPGGFPKQQFYFEGLNSSSSYHGVLVRTGNSTIDFRRQEQDDGSGLGSGKIAGGGVVYEPVEFLTSSGHSCKVITDMEFCDINQYAVPGSAKYNGTELAQIYDSYARRMYENFEKVMMQIPCETESTSAYSLARNCNDCEAAYKRWLCTVAVPRCEDFSSENPFAFIRNAGTPFPNGTMLPLDVRLNLENKVYHNNSRNRFIDQEFEPGPYKEVLPCEDLCYEVVQSCPASIGFTCPRPGYTGFGASYGRRRDDRSEITCNYPGEPRTKTGAGLSVVPRLALGFVPLVLAWLL